MTPYRRLLLGPQRPHSNIPEALDRLLLPEGPLAVITAGWQEGEQDLDELAAVVGRPLLDLRLYQRAEAVFADDARLHQAYRDRQDQLIRLQSLYRTRLRFLANAAREVLKAEEDADMIEPEQRHAIAQLRALDRHHLQRTDTIQQAFEREYNIDDHAALKAHADELAATLGTARAVLIAGGNVLVLLNRMRLFGLDRMLGGLPLIAWSAGAMVLAERVVLYHDRAPQGRRNAELMGSGIGLLPGHVFLPDASRRLKTEDRQRISLFCRRFAPDGCLTLDPGTLLEFHDQTLRTADRSRRMTRGGRLGRIRVS